MACDSPAAILVDSLGNAVNIYFDGSVYRIRTETITSQLPTSLISGRLDVNVGSWLGSIAPTAGQKVKASSIPVVIASDQGALAISAASLPLPTGAATETTLVGILTDTGNISTFTNSIDSKVATAVNQINGTQKSIARGGAKGATAAADVTSTAEGVDHQALDVQLYGSAGNAAAVTTANALKVDGSAVTQPISAISLPLPIGAAQEHATADNPSSIRLSDGATFYDATKTGQLPSALVGGRLDTNTGSWLGSTAPTIGQKNMASSIPVVIPSDQTLSISGIVTANIGTTGGLALDNTVSALQVAQGSITAGQNGTLMQGAVTTATPSYINNQTSPLSLTISGALRSDVTTIAGVAPTTAGKIDVKGADGDVFVRQTTASNLNALVAQGAPNTIVNRWPVQHTDGTNTMPTGDVAARAIFNKLTDGTNTTAVKAASTAAIAIDPSVVVALSPNSPLPAGTNIVGSLVANQTVNLNQVAGNAVTTQAAGEQLIAVEGRAASGAPVTGNPVLSGGSDGTNARSLLTDISGRQQIVGAASDGTAVTGNPVLIGGQDGANAQSLLTDTSGRPNMVGAAAQGAAVAGNPVLMAGEDASGNVGRFQTRTAPPVGTTAGQVVRQIASQTGTTSNIASSASSVQLLAANTARLGVFIVNDSSKKLYVKCGTTASTTDYTKLLGAGEDWQVPFGYTGRIDGIWEAANGNARLTEFI